MSAPSRTEIEAEKRGISDRIVVFSLAYALTVSGLFDAPELPRKLPKGRALQDVAWDSSPDLRAAIRARWHRRATFLLESAIPSHFK
jgi:hypothetical protein